MKSIVQKTAFCHNGGPKGLDPKWRLEGQLLRTVVTDDDDVFLDVFA